QNPRDGLRMGVSAGANIGKSPQSCEVERAQLRKWVS
ncbi:hypothetical protein PSYMO_37626, partial [Pseudomonas amygdali pv. mori str. 301020]